jgi:hypothetical protein
MHHPMPFLLSALAILSLIVGLAGIVRGGATAKTHGRQTLMHFPAPGAWLQHRLLTAKSVVWIGKLYLIAGMALGTAAFINGLNRITPGLSSARCDTLALSLMDINWTGSTWTAFTQDNHTNGCHTLIKDQDGVRWFSIHAGPIDGLIGEGFNTQSAVLQRAGLSLSQVPQLAKRAVFASHDTSTAANPTLLFEDGTMTTRVEINGQTVTPKRFAAIIDTVRQTQGPY